MAQAITPFDAETVMMLRGLTQRESFITPFDDNFTIHAFYSKHNAPDYISAIIDAVRGRTGERFIEVNDNPEIQGLKYTIAYDTHEYPTIDGTKDISAPNLLCAKIYERDNDKCCAAQVRRDNRITVERFCGNGTLQIERHPGGKAWFTFLNNGVYVDVPENDYIVRRKDSNAFEIWKKADFEKEWKMKN